LVLRQTGPLKSQDIASLWRSTEERALGFQGLLHIVAVSPEAPFEGPFKSGDEVGLYPWRREVPSLQLQPTTGEDREVQPVLCGAVGVSPAWALISIESSPGKYLPYLINYLNYADAKSLLVILPLTKPPTKLIPTNRQAT